MRVKSLARIPKSFKNLVRRSKKTTFIYPNNQAIRIVKECKHANFLSKNGYFYSSSANKHGKEFDEEWARSVADIILDEKFFRKYPIKNIKTFKE